MNILAGTLSALSLDYFLIAGYYEKVVIYFFMAIQQISKDSFKTEVLDYEGFVFIDFYADWCGPCKLTAPIIDKLAGEMKNIKFVKINVDENSDLAQQYSVFSIPTFMVFKKGKIVSQFVGAMGKEGFQSEINKALSS